MTGARRAGPGPGADPLEAAHTPDLTQGLEAHRARGQNLLLPAGQRPRVNTAVTGRGTASPRPTTPSAMRTGTGAKGNPHPATPKLGASN